MCWIHLDVVGQWVRNLLLLQIGDVFCRIVFFWEMVTNNIIGPKQSFAHKFIKLFWTYRHYKIFLMCRKQLFIPFNKNKAFITCFSHLPIYLIVVLKRIYISGFAYCQHDNGHHYPAEDLFVFEILLRGNDNPRNHDMHDNIWPRCGKYL